MTTSSDLGRALAALRPVATYTCEVCREPFAARQAGKQRAPRTCTPACRQKRYRDAKMAEHHVARCDAPGCGKEEALTQTTVTTNHNLSGFSFATAYTFGLPAGWRRIENAVVCSWACLSAYAAKCAEHSAGHTAR